MQPARLESDAAARRDSAARGSGRGESPQHGSEPRESPSRGSEPRQPRESPAPGRQPRESAPRGGERRALVAGGGGALGSALLEHALGCGGFAEVAALVTQPLDAALRGFRALRFAGVEQAPPREFDTAWVVFDRERHANGREQAFYRPQPHELSTLARWLHAGGVRRLVVVLPHAPGLLPQALQRGLASLDEQAVAALGFEQFVIVRSAQPADRARAASWPQRVAQLWFAQLRWMIPQREQPVRASSVAAFAVQVALALDRARPGTRVAPPELVWQAAQGGDVAALVSGWLSTPP